MPIPSSFALSVEDIRPDCEEEALRTVFLVGVILPWASWEIASIKVAEVERAKSLGIRGIKLHPDCQHFSIDDPKMDKIYAACSDYDLPILMHTGDDRYDNSRPPKMAAVARRFPKGRFIAAHFGGYSNWEYVDCYEGTQNVWFDTSSTLFKIKSGEPERLIKKFGADRFFFGTDYPLFGSEPELARFRKLDRDDETQQKILYQNAVDFLHL